jgi:hypothetical protein
MSNGNRLALAFGIVMAGGALVTGVAVADEAPVVTEEITQQIGVSASSYKYVEDNFMSLKGPMLGVDYSVKFALSGGWFVKGDVRYSRGDVDYEGSGSAKNQTTWYLEPRLLAGYDFTLGSHTLGSFTGLGFRYLFHDGRGVTSTNHHYGYRRESRYLYLPIGLAHRWSLGERSSLTTTIEYDYLIEGRQTSELNDGSGIVNTPDYTTYVYQEALKNDQNTGHGWRGSIMLTLGNWSMGPYANYWRLSTSDVGHSHGVDDVGQGWITYGVEPKNKTEEAGFKAFYLF